MTSAAQKIDEPQTQHGIPAEPAAESEAQAVLEQAQEAFDSAKEATYNALSASGQDNESEATLTATAIGRFLETLSDKPDTELGKAAKFIQSQLEQITAP